MPGRAGSTSPPCSCNHKERDGQEVPGRAGLTRDHEEQMAA